MRSFFTFEWYPYSDDYCESVGIDGIQDEVPALAALALPPGT